jgi:hypothetical protein
VHSSSIRCIVLLWTGEGEIRHGPPSHVLIGSSRAPNAHPTEVLGLPWDHTGPSDRAWSGKGGAARGSESLPLRGDKRCTPHVQDPGARGILGPSRKQ